MKTEASRLRQAFWTVFGQYMAPVPSANGLPVSWLNYRTGVKGVQFRLSTDHFPVRIALALTTPDATLRELHWEQLVALRPLLHETLGEAWAWEPNTELVVGHPMSQVYKELPGVSVLRRDDWPALISFFKPRLIALDAFWNEAQAAFEDLQ